MQTNVLEMRCSVHDVMFVHKHNHDEIVHAYLIGDMSVVHSVSYIAIQSSWLTAAWTLANRALGLMLQIVRILYGYGFESFQSSYIHVYVLVS